MGFRGLPCSGANADHNLVLAFRIAGPGPALGLMIFHKVDRGAVEVYRARGVCPLGVNGVATAQEQASDFAGVKVLVIDDSKTIRRAADTLLTERGCEVVTAVDGFEALAKIVDHEPQLIFVDVTMPRLDGYQTCALIKNNAHFRDTPVIMLTSKDGLFDRARGRLVGSDQYLTKPFTGDELATALQTQLEHIISQAPNESIEK